MDDIFDDGRTNHVAWSELTRELCNCVLCSAPGDASHPFVDTGYLTQVKCRSCGMVYANPRYTDAALATLYAKYMRREYAEPPRHRAAQCERLVATLTRLAPDARSLLDVGCANGNFLRVAARAFDVAGVEPSAHGRELATQAGFHVVSDVSQITEKYDVVVCLEVIEHVREPVPFARSITARVKPGGLLVISTGQVDGLYARVAGSRWSYLATPEHLNLFSWRTLLRLLSTAAHGEVVHRAGAVGLGLRDMVRIRRHYDSRRAWVKALVGKAWIGNMVVGQTQCVFYRLSEPS